MMSLTLGEQRAPVANPYTGLNALVAATLRAQWNTTRGKLLTQAGGENTTFEHFARIHRTHDGEFGVCFEYAIHHGATQQMPMLVERLSDALKLCRISTTSPSSILVGVEKGRFSRLIDSAISMLTPTSRLLQGGSGRPVNILKHLRAAFGSTETPLPPTILGLTKADLIVGDQGSEQWVATTLKLHYRHLEPAPGLRVGIYPIDDRHDDDRPRRDDKKNLVLCPLRYDSEFMELFMSAYRIVTSVVRADCRMPPPHALSALERRVADDLVRARDVPVLELIQSLEVLGQPSLVESQSACVEVTPLDESPAPAELALVAPVANEI